MLLFDEKKRRFYFQCAEKKCRAVFSSEFEDAQDIRDIHEETLYLECECGGKATLMWD